jgi:hypothetical protein
MGRHHFLATELLRRCDAEGRVEYFTLHTPK